MKVHIYMIGWQAAYAAARELERRKQWPAAASLYSRALAFGQKDNANLNYRLGHSHFQDGKLTEAILFTRHAVELQPANSIWQYKLGFYYERQKSFDKALVHYEAALEIDPAVAAWHYRSYSCHAALGNRLDAEDSLKQAIAHDPGNTKYHQLLAASLKQSAPRWQELDVLKAGLHLHADDHDWHSRLADAHSFLSHHEESAIHHAKVNQLNPNISMAHYQEGYHWELAGNAIRAKAAYARAIATDKKLDSKIHGIGAFHQAKERWPAAKAAYGQKVAEGNSTAESWYRYGFSLDRTSDWPAAAEAYETAVALNPTEANWRYKLGFALERSQRWTDAGGAYLAAASMREGKTYWYYRAGYCFEKAGEYIEACDAYIQSSPITSPFTPETQENPKPSKFLRNHSESMLRSALRIAPSIHDSKLLESLTENTVFANDPKAAIQLYSETIRRSNDHSPSTYYRLGHALMSESKFRAAAQAFRQSRIFMTPDGVNVNKYLKNNALKKSMLFIEAMESIPLAEKTILWESNHGASIGCHPLAVFKELNTDSKFGDFHHVWAINDPESIPPELLQLKNVSFTRTHSDNYLKTLATSKYVVNNVSFPPYYIRRDGQQYLNTWHGTPFKTLGKDMNGPILQHANLARNFLQATHLMSPNEHTSWSLIDRHDIEGVFTGKIQVTGSPRLDQMINSQEVLQKQIRKGLGIAESDQRPIVLFAPTWRGSTNERSVDTSAVLRDIEALSDVGHHLLFRAHRLTESLLKDLEIPAIVVPKKIDTSDLLAAVDVLVTDYSSISFDFLPRKKPIVYFTPDFEEYSAERGLYLTPEDMPGTFCYDHQQLAQAIAVALNDPERGRNDYKAAIERFSPMEDGRASRRVVDFFFNNRIEGTTEEAQKEVLLFHQSLIPNGIATSFLNLITSIDQSKYRIVLVVEPNVISNDPARLEIFHRLPEYVQVIGRVGVYAQRPAERHLAGVMAREFKLTSTEQKRIYIDGFSREFRRIFGNIKFDAHIEFDGYSPTWCSLMSTGSSTTTKLIYLHNDMIQEWIMKYPDLEAVFGLYDRYDKCISVAKEVAAINRVGISDKFNIDDGKFTYSNNQIDVTSVVKNSESELDPDIHKWFSDAAFNFLAIGRMSPEKDHQKLIRAFDAFHKNNTDSNLTIIGDGPLRRDLENLIKEIQAGDFIWLAGQRSNPYPALKNSDAFVLPSLHEGQPMVLFEAMILDKSILCTDMPGPRGVLEGSHGLVVENSFEGLRDGLQIIKQGTIRHETFDSKAYQTEARECFLGLALPERESSSQDRTNNSGHKSFLGAIK